MIDNLTFEIIKRITADVGAVPDKAVGTRGLANSDLLLQKTLSVRYEGGKTYEHDIYSGKLQFGESELKGLLIDLSLEGAYEFLFMFRFDMMPIHAIRVIHNHPEDSFIRIYNSEKDTWIVPSLFMTARLLADFERFVSWGFLWDECKETSDLYDVAVKLVD
jgi:hypothetical protein